uniref:UPAR/Ly6 domain-containing protein n=1 Tax=Loxodonta africana TaxID=9785 RepID=G3U4W2_LOXAF
MCPAALKRLFLACSLALVPFLAVSWEIKMSDLEEKDVDEFSSNGLKCPTCLAVRGGECDTELKWCAKDKIKCVEFHGIINTGISNIAIEMKRCIKADLCEESVTSYMNLPVANESIRCRSAIINGAKSQPPTPIFFILFLEKLLH